MCIYINKYVLTAWRCFFSKHIRKTYTSCSAVSVSELWIMYIACMADVLEWRLCESSSFCCCFFFSLFHSSSHWALYHYISYHSERTQKFHRVAGICFSYVCQRAKTIFHILPLLSAHRGFDKSNKERRLFKAFEQLFLLLNRVTYTLGGSGRKHGVCKIPIIPWWKWTDKQQHIWICNKQLNYNSNPQLIFIVLFSIMINLYYNSQHEYIGFSNVFLRYAFNAIYSSIQPM